MVREIAERIFEGVSGYRHQNLKTFKARPILDGHPIGGRGDVELCVQFVTTENALESTRDAARRSSNLESGKDALHWVVLLDEDAVDCVDEIHRSRTMVRRYEPERLSPEQSRLLSDEKSREARLHGHLVTLLDRAFTGGDSFLRGVQTPLAEFGDALRDNIRGALQVAVPKLFPKFDLAATRVGTRDAVKILESESMSGLPSVYYEGGSGLGLIRLEAGKRVVVSDHRALAEVAEFIRERKSYGEDASGRTLEDRFTGFGYGWDLEALKLITATLFRDTQIEVYKGKRYTSYADPGVRDVFGKTQPFRSATFVPRSDKGVALQELTACHKTLERVYGKSVPIEERAIAFELRERMPSEATRVHRSLHQLKALSLPGHDRLQNLIEDLEGITQSSAEDTILAFYNQREPIAAGLERLRPLEAALTEANAETLRSAQSTVEKLWPELRLLGEDTGLRDVVEALRARLEDPEFFRHLGDLAQRTGQVRSVYEERRAELGRKLEDTLRKHEDDLRNRPAWETLDETAQAGLLADFERVRRRLEDAHTSLTELDSLRRGLDSTLAWAVAELVRLSAELPSGGGEVTAPTVRRISVRGFAGTGLHTAEDVDAALKALREECLAALAKGEIVVLE